MHSSEMKATLAARSMRCLQLITNVLVEVLARWNAGACPRRIEDLLALEIGPESQEVNHCLSEAVVVAGVTDEDTHGLLDVVRT